LAHEDASRDRSNRLLGVNRVTTLAKPIQLIEEDLQTLNRASGRLRAMPLALRISGINIAKFYFGR
jgi:hypothetical protein